MRFVLDENLLQNASKFAILLLEYKTHAVAFFIFHWGKNKVASNEKRKKTTRAFIFLKYDKF